MKDNLKNHLIFLSSSERILAYSGKRPYSRPELKKYGSVGKLTKAGNSSGTDKWGKLQGASDRCIKENVVQIDTHFKNFGLYLFDYKAEYRDRWGHGRQFGVMADEVEKVMPEAVSLHSDGYKMVDYGMLGITRTLH